MRQVNQALSWVGVFRAIFTLMVVPELAKGLPMNPRNSRTLKRSSQTIERRSNGQLSTRDDAWGNYTTQDGSEWRGPGMSALANNTDDGEFSAIVNKFRTRLSGEKENTMMYRLRSKSLRRATNELLKRQTSTLLSRLNKRSISLSKDRPYNTQGTTTNFETFLPQRKRSRSALLSRPMEDDQISANILDNSVTTYQGSSPLSLTINESDNLDEFKSSSDSFSSSSTWASLSSYPEDDVHVNRTDSMPSNHSRLHRNRLRGFNISHLLSLRRCQENLTNSVEGNDDDSSVRILKRSSRGVESQGCQVLNVLNGYITITPQGQVATTWDPNDINTRLYIFSIGPGYSRIKGIAANRYLHMDDAGAVTGILASEVPEPYDSTNSKGAWYEAPGTCQGRRWIQWYRNGGSRNERWYLAFNGRGRPIGLQRNGENKCSASFMKTLSAGVSCNPNDGGHTNI